MQAYEVDMKGAQDGVALPRANTGVYISWRWVYGAAARRKSNTLRQLKAFSYSAALDH